MPSFASLFDASSRSRYLWSSLFQPKLHQSFTINFDRKDAVGYIENICKPCVFSDEFEIPSEGYDNVMVAMMHCLEFLLNNSLKSYLNIAAKRWIPDLVEILKLDVDKVSSGFKKKHF